MKKSEILEKLKDLQKTVEGRFDCECEDDTDWMIQHESTLSMVENRLNEILNDEEKPKTRKQHFDDIIKSASHLK